MRELLRTTDPVTISWAVAMLAAEDIEAFVFDRHTSLIEGSVAAIAQRVMVADEEYSRARRLMLECGFASLSPDRAAW
ncbi:MAG: DUF2007 domain-containing protein [Alphaproteobacteria bacterium]